jgi:hypothetical protein
VAAKVKAITVDVSYNGGRTWSRVSRPEPPIVLTVHIPCPQVLHTALHLHTELAAERTVHVVREAADLTGGPAVVIRLAVRVPVGAHSSLDPRRRRQLIT